MSKIILQTGTLTGLNNQTSLNIKTLAMDSVEVNEYVSSLVTQNPFLDVTESRILKKDEDNYSKLNAAAVAENYGDQYDYSKFLKQRLTSSGLNSTWADNLEETISGAVSKYENLSVQNWKVKNF